MIAQRQWESTQAPQRQSLVHQMFTPNLPLTFGNAGRNIVVGLDPQLRFFGGKKTKIGETRKNCSQE